MEFDTDQAVALLRELGKQTTAARRHVATLVDAVGGGRMASTGRSAATNATIEARRALLAAHTCTSRLRDHLVPVDGLGELGEHAAELAVRTVRMVVLAEIARVRALCAPASGEQPVADLVVAAFSAFEEETEIEFERITDVWTMFRVHPSDPDVPIGQRREYEAIIRAAYCATKRVRLLPALDHFVRLGLPRDDLPAVQNSCRRIAAVFAIDLGVAHSPGPKPWLVSDEHAVYRITARAGACGRPEGP